MSILAVNHLVHYIIHKKQWQYDCIHMYKYPMQYSTIRAEVTVIEFCWEGDIVKKKYRTKNVFNIFVLAKTNSYNYTYAWFIKINDCNSICYLSTIIFEFNMMWPRKVVSMFICKKRHRATSCSSYWTTYTNWEANILILYSNAHFLYHITYTRLVQNFEFLMDIKYFCQSTVIRFLQLFYFIFASKSLQKEITEN